MMIMPPMSDPSEPSERMERSDNPKALSWALIVAGIGAAGAAAYILTRPKRTPLPSAEQIAAGAVPGVTLAPSGDSQVQTGLKVAANPFANATVSVRPTAAFSSDAELGQKVNQVYAWARPILAYAHGVTMDGASMTGYRRLNGPFDIVKAGLGTVSNVASTVSSTASDAQRRVAEAEAAARAAAVTAANFAAGRTGSTATLSDNGWSQVFEWLKTGRLPLDRSAGAWRVCFQRVGCTGANWFATNSADTVNALLAPLPSGSTGKAGVPFSASQISMMHSFTQQLYDLWTRGGPGAEARPRDNRFAPAMDSRYRNHPFEFLRMEANKG